MSDEPGELPWLDLDSYGFSRKLEAQAGAATVLVQLDLSGSELRSEDQQTWRAVFDQITSPVDLQAVIAGPLQEETDETFYLGTFVQNTDKTLTAACLLRIAGMSDGTAGKIGEGLARQFIPAAVSAFVAQGYFKLETSCLNELETAYNASEQRFEW